MRTFGSIVCLLVASFVVGTPAAGVAGTLSLSTNQIFRGLDPDTGIFEFETVSGRFEKLFEDQSLVVSRHLRTSGVVRPTGFVSVSNSTGEAVFSISVEATQAGTLLMYSSNVLSQDEPEPNGAIRVEIEEFTGSAVVTVTLSEAGQGVGRCAICVRNTVGGAILQETTFEFTNESLFDSSVHRLSHTVGAGGAGGTMRTESMDTENTNVTGYRVVPDEVCIERISWAKGGVVLGWAGGKGQRFNVLRSPRLWPGAYEQIATGISVVLGETVYFDQLLSGSQAFYRVVREATTVELVE